MSTRPWYHGGLRFECIGCGRCCTGAPGHVWVTRAETEVLAAALRLDVAEFREQYVRRVGNRRSLVELVNGDCIFFERESRECRVYTSRPAQCRTWPFWPSNLRTPQTWQETCRACPGSGRGPLVAWNEIKARAGVVRI